MIGDKSLPPEPIIADGQILNFNEIRQWAMLNDPIWNAVETHAQQKGLETWETLEYLLVVFLRQNHKQQHLLYDYANRIVPWPPVFSPSGPEAKP